MSSVIRRILTDHGGLRAAVDEVADDDDLYAAGLTSHATITVMLACEDAFGVEFPQALVRRSTFTTVSSLRAALVQLGATVDDGSLVAGSADAGDTSAATA